MRWIGADYGTPRGVREGSRKRVLVLTRYGRLAASTRVRFLQFIEHFERDASCPLDFDVAPLLEDHALQQFYNNGTRDPVYLFQRYFKRLAVLMTCRRYDSVWIEKEIFPALPAIAERVLTALGVRTVVDYDDATYVWYKQNPQWLFRALLGRKIEAVCASAHRVVAGNATLSEFARAAGARDVVLVPSVISIDKYLKHRSSLANNDSFVVGWIGTPSNVRYLDIYRDALVDLAALPGFKFLTIGAPDQLFDGVPQDAHPWSEATEIDLLAECHCMLAPVDDGAWEGGKCGFKVIQGMAAGLPVIASPVGVIREIIRHGENGFLAETGSECRDAFDRLLADPGLRDKIGAAARSTVARFYALSTEQNRLLGVLSGTPS